jgi:hypothetical protein
MTCVIGVTTEEGRTFLAGDSFCGDDDISDICKAPKVFQMGPLGFGISGSPRSEHVLIRSVHHLLHSDNPPTIDSSWLTYAFPDIIRKDMYEAGAVKEEEGIFKLYESEYIVAHKGKLYCLDDTFAMLEYRRPYMAIGGGKYLAYGALAYAHKQGHLAAKYAEKSLLSILDCVSGWSPVVRPPFTVIEVL